ncbi:MAG: cell division protein ZapA [Alphaproteobacteria bacterium]|nr:cell division protein ZapA [Alphaproteobacteria bacterium]
MALVDIAIGKDTHQIACSDGEEEKIHRLASRFKEKIEALHQSFPSATDKTLYLMAGMMIIDELEETSGATSKPQDNSENEETAKMLDDITEKVEGLIKKLETTCDA